MNPQHETAAPPNWARRITEATMAISLGIMVLAVFINVLLRYGFDTGIVFYEELSRLMFVWLVCIGAVLAAAEGKHLGFDMVISRLKGWPLKACTLLAQLATAYCLILVAKGSWEQVKAGMHTFSTVIGYPLALAAAGTLVMSVGMLIVLALQISGRLNNAASDAESRVE
ncbi:TRAP transporter small permease [Uliginosibacterium sediminicola]|uniref:TRAP transporter small permease protein n=1 Tax=Uliginosibacterium sediminicola TaxID=2024550 RepID=A0ABU9YYT7_9RHOO